MKRDRITLCFFIDALGWELAERHRCFEAVAPHRYRQRTVLGYSCAAQPTILPGAMPSEHGDWAMFYRTERSDLAVLKHLRMLPPALGSHWRVRRQIFKLHKRWSGLTGYYNFYCIPFGLFAQFDICEKRNIYAPEAFESGVPSIFDDLEREAVPYRAWTWRTPLEQSFAELGDTLDSDADLRFVLLYTAYLDGFLHANIGDEAAVETAIRSIERLVVKAVERAHETSEKVDVLVFSDHGMTPTTRERDLMRDVHSLELAPKSDYLAFYDSTMARFWFSNNDARKEIVDMLSGLSCGTILESGQLREEGVWFEDERFGELVFLMNPGTLVVPSYMGAKAPKGMHGFSPDHPDSHAILMSSEELEPDPGHIRDTYTVMKRLAGAGS